MFRFVRRATSLVVTVGLGLAVVAPASAQSSAPRGGNGRTAPPYGVYGPYAPYPGYRYGPSGYLYSPYASSASGGPTVIVEPPEPLIRNSLGLLERNYQYLRNTSPNPDRYEGGRWNPRVTVINPQPPIAICPPVYCPNPFGYYGYLPPYLAPERVYVERTLIIREPAGDGASARGAGYSAPAPDRSRPESAPAGSDFYLSPPTAEPLSAALDDLRRAWLNGDFERFRARVRTDAKIRIYPGGKYAYSLAAEDFLQIARDAMTKIDTVGFEFDAPPANPGTRVLVTGKHSFTDPGGQKREVFVSYGLERGRDGKWRITEAGSSTQKITAHQD